MTKDELRKLRLANLKKGREKKAALKDAQHPIIKEEKKTVESDIAKGIEQHPPLSEPPPPLPPLSGPAPITGQTPLPGVPAPGPVLDDEKLRKGMGLAFTSSLRGLENLFNTAFSSGGKFHYEIEKLDPAEEELWGTFALPVLKKYFPKFEETPEYALIFVSVAILSGKIHVKREVTNARAENNQTSHATP